MAGTPRKIRFIVERADAGRRLDQVLAARVPGLSRRQARVLLDLGGVFVDRARVKVAGRTMRAGQTVEAVVGSVLARATAAVGGAARARDEAKLPSFRVVLEDDDLVVVDKPSGLLAAPTPESDRNNLADLLARRGLAPKERRERAPRRAIFVVHRIDLETSGLLVFAKNDDTNRALAALFRDHRLTREYRGVVVGRFPETIASIDRPLSGRRAITHLAVEERFGERATLLRARLETGRTHQIRLHALSVGHPVLGDRRYGTQTAFDPPRMALHATRLAFEHPRTGEKVDLESPLPADLTTWIETLRSGSPRR